MQSYRISIAGLIKDGWNVRHFGERLSVIVLYDGVKARVVHDLCPHMGGPLSQGDMCKKKRAIVCPWHGYRFSASSLELQENPNERIWIEPLAGHKASEFCTPKYKLRELPFRIESGDIVIEETAV